MVFIVRRVLLSVVRGSLFVGRCLAVVGGFALFVVCYVSCVVDVLCVD